MTDSYRQIIDVLTKCKRVLVTTHVRPDGDALGTAAAMVLGMRKAGVEAEVLLLSHLPTKYAFIFKEYGIEWHDVEKGWPGEGGEGGAGSGVRGSGFGLEETRTSSPAAGSSADALSSPPIGIRHSEFGMRSSSHFLRRFDALLVVDTGTWSQLPGLKERVEGWGVPKLVVDHHLTQEDWADVKLVVTEAGAAAEVAAELLQQWGIGFDRAIATALYLGIVSDTGWFQFSSTRPYTMRLAAGLMEAGVDTDRLYQLLYQNERPERVALQTRAMGSLELLAGGRLAVMRVWKKDFEETRAGTPDTENLINAPLQIRTVEVSILATEPTDGGPVRISLRSKGRVDVARFAEQFGGGGHARASGLKVDGSFDEAHGRVVAAMLRTMGG